MMPHTKPSTSQSHHLNYQHPSLGITPSNTGSSWVTWEQEKDQQILAEICDSIHEVSSDMFIITAFKGLNPSQKKVCKEKLENSLERLCTLIKDNELLVLENNSVCLVLSEILGALEAILPGIFKRMPKFKHFLHSFKKQEFI